MELRNNLNAFEALDARIVAIAQEERDPTTMSRVESFVGDGIRVVCDPKNTTNQTIERYGIYIVERGGRIQTYLPGTKAARPRLDVLLDELAMVAGKDAPEFQFGGVDTGDGDGSAELRSPAAAITTRWMWSHDVVRPGDPLKLALLPRVADGYHVYGHVEAQMTPFEVEVEVPKGLRMTEPIGYPEGKLEADPQLETEMQIYRGHIPISALVFEADDELPDGELTVRVTLSFQACDDNSCLAPAKKILELTIPATTERKRRGQVFGWNTW